MARKFIFFDIETTHPGLDAEIVQIAAAGSQREIPDFSVYILPHGEISPAATDLHSIEKKSGKLYRKGDPLTSFSPKEGLEKFHDWILKHFYENSALLVSHNAFKYQAPVLIKNMIANGFDEEELEGLIHGFADTLPTFRQFYPELSSYDFEFLLRQFAIPINRLHDAKQNALYLLNLVSVGSRRKEFRMDPFLMTSFRDITTFMP